MSRIRRRYNKGKKVRGINIETGELGFWRKTQVQKRLSRGAYNMLLQLNPSGIIREEEE